MILRVDETGRLEIPSEMAARFGLRPGARVQMDEDGLGLHLRRPPTSLAKLYIEPTVRCNLACRTCIRNIWDEQGGDMTDAIFARVLDGLHDLPEAAGCPPTIFFGGFGEPLAHPRIVEMVAAVKALGCPTELITNGILLTEQMSRRLIAAGLDRLWVSLDGARPESYADVRLGAALPTVLANVARFRDSRSLRRPRRPEIAIAFVAMRHNLADLPQVLALGDQLGAVRFLVTNVLPYTADMRSEILYGRSSTDICYLRSPWTPHLTLPKIDVDALTAPILYDVLRSDRNISLLDYNLGNANDHCPFIEAGAAVVGADGGLSPCLPLLHDHVSYLNDRERRSHRYIIGSLAERSLGDLWRAPEHIAFRERVQAFNFAPCTFCGGCDYSLANQEDCFGNSFPTCGGCLWAQGLIRCP